jgi:hypothetical protein
MPTVQTKVDNPTLITPVISLTEEEVLLTKYVSEAEYWETYYRYPDINFEWNNGRLERVPMTNLRQFQAYEWFKGLLMDYLFVHRNGVLIGLEMGFRLSLPDRSTIRKPDLGLVHTSNPVPLRDLDGSYKGIFDLVVESLSVSSETEIYRDSVTKRDEYALGGVKEYFILDERGEETRFYQLSSQGTYLPIPILEGIVRSGVLPGFQFRPEDLSRQPTPGEMLDDSVYRGFVSPALREERERADQEKARADQADARAEQEKARAEQEKARADELAHRADQYAALLRKLGHLPPEDS